MNKINEYETLTSYYKLYGKYCDHVCGRAIFKNSIVDMNGGADVKSKSMPEPVKLFLQTLKLTSEEIPVVGELISVINVIISSSVLFTELMELINQSVELKTIIDRLTFKNGIDDCVKLIDSFTDDDFVVLCTYAPQLLDLLKLNISDWISTIPNVGPVLALAIQRNATFKSVSEMYSNLPQNIKDLFQDPDQLIILGDQMIEIFRIDLLPTNINQSNENNLEGGSISSKLSDLAQKTKNMSETILIRSTAPTRYVLNKLGTDKIIINKTLEYFDKVLKPSLVGSSECLKIILPLFFILLIIDDSGKCH